MRMLCYKCNHSWTYKGKNTEEEDYITCPGCYRKIRLGKALIDDLSEQELLTSSPKKRMKTTSFPLKLLTTSLERVYFPDGFDCLVHKDISKQFKELLLEDLEEEEIEEVEDVQEQESVIRILPPKFEIRVIPTDPIKILEHQMSFL